MGGTWLWQRAPNLAAGASLVGTAGFLLVLDLDPLTNFSYLGRLGAWP